MKAFEEDFPPLTINYFQLIYVLDVAMSHTP